jgi:exodeoxyribonuclease V alpha subunit
MPDVKPGETIRCQGEWKQHLAYGRQFTISSYKIESPSDIVGIKKYLGSGLIKGIGAKYANRIVEKFDISTLDIIDKNPERLKEIEGLGKKRIESITKCWTEQKSIRQVMIFLQGHGVTPAYAQKIYKTYGEKSIDQMQSNPYKIARDIHGIGFKTADAIAQKLGIPKDSPDRIDAGIEFTLLACGDDGHVCQPITEFLVSAQEMLDADPSLIESRFEPLIADKRIEIGQMVFDGVLASFIWLRRMFLSEVGIAKQIMRLKRCACSLRSVDTAKALEWVQKQLSIQLAPNQIDAVVQSLQEKVQIITGGPGTGKSTITKAVLAITEKLSSKIILAAPTGRAAKRMTEITGKKASTLHSLLEFDFKKGGFKKGYEDPLDCDLIIVDEASMIDTQLMYSLLKAIPNNARVIFVGDINQLPSVGAGNVLKDMIASQAVPVTILNQIFRQAEGSKIITNAHRINNGAYPDIQNTPGSDFYFMEANEPEDVQKIIVSLVTQRLPKTYGFNPIDDIQVLAPMRRGVIGTESLNIQLQEVLTPKGEAVTWAGRRFLRGDKVMQIRNDYQKEVFNGDIGRIESIDFEDQEVSVVFDGKSVIYPFTDLDDLVLAYAVSVHKFQGSECPCVVMPIHTTHFKLLHRNLLYTGITRGKKLVVLVGMTKAIALAVKNDEVKKRYTGLKQALITSLSPEIPMVQ